MQNEFKNTSTKSFKLIFSLLLNVKNYMFFFALNSWIVRHLSKIEVRQLLSHLNAWNFLDSFKLKSNNVTSQRRKQYSATRRIEQYIKLSTKSSSTCQYVIDLQDALPWQRIELLGNSNKEHRERRLSKTWRVKVVTLDVNILPSYFKEERLDLS